MKRKFWVSVYTLLALYGLSVTAFTAPTTYTEQWILNKVYDNGTGTASIMASAQNIFNSVYSPTGAALKVKFISGGAPTLLDICGSGCIINSTATGTMALNNVNLQLRGSSAIDATGGITSAATGTFEALSVDSGFFTVNPTGIAGPTITASSSSFIMPRGIDLDPSMSASDFGHASSSFDYWEFAPQCITDATCSGIGAGLRFKDYSNNYFFDINQSLKMLIGWGAGYATPSMVLDPPDQSFTFHPNAFDLFMQKDDDSYAFGVFASGEVYFPFLSIANKSIFGKSAAATETWRLRSDVPQLTMYSYSTTNADVNLKDNSNNTSIELSSGETGVESAKLYLYTPDTLLNSISLDSANSVDEAEIKLYNRTKATQSVSIGGDGVIAVGDDIQGGSLSVVIGESIKGITAYDNSMNTTVQLEGTTGNIYASGTISTDGDLLVNDGTVFVYDGLGNVKAAMDPAGNVWASGSFTAGGIVVATATLNTVCANECLTSYAMTASSTLAVSGQVDLGDDLNINGSGGGTGNLYVANDTTLKGNTYATGTLSVTGGIYSNGINDVGGIHTDSTLHADGAVTASSTLSVSGTSDLSIVNASGAIHGDSTLHIDGAITASSTMSLTGDLNLGDDLDALGTVTAADLVSSKTVEKNFIIPIAGNAGAANTPTSNASGPIAWRYFDANDYLVYNFAVPADYADSATDSVELGFAFMQFAASTGKEIRFDIRYECHNYNDTTLTYTTIDTGDITENGTQWQGQEFATVIPDSAFNGKEYCSFQLARTAIAGGSETSSIGLRHIDIHYDAEQVQQ